MPGLLQRGTRVVGVRPVRRVIPARHQRVLTLGQFGPTGGTLEKRRVCRGDVWILLIDLWIFQRRLMVPQNAFPWNAHA